MKLNPHSLTRTAALVVVVTGVALAAPPNPTRLTTQQTKTDQTDDDEGASESAPAEFEPGRITIPAIEKQAAETKSPNQLGDKAADDILELRQFRGSVLDGTSLGDDPEQNQRIFAEVVRELASNNPPPPPTAPRELPTDHALIDSLRQSARLLDEKASDLEPTRQFERADELRVLADDLRLQARRLDGWVPAHSSD
ncbi:MAG: hypothetical protein QGG36_24835 [Pirellulaceae bacterium]|jgi:hypothetical protein|nr:hypothetical protein [Pirellulaceae bacterium]MDP7019046.1 hypothetical protein [Pirellulaceae bacterium]